MAYGQQAHELATRKLKRKKVHISRYSLATNHFLTSDAVGCIRSLEKIVQVKLVVSWAGACRAPVAMRCSMESTDWMPPRAPTAVQLSAAAAQAKSSCRCKGRPCKSP